MFRRRSWFHVHNQDRFVVSFAFFQTRVTRFGSKILFISIADEIFRFRLRARFPKCMVGLIGASQPLLRSVHKNGLRIVWNLSYFKTYLIFYNPVCETGIHLLVLSYEDILTDIFKIVSYPGVWRKRSSY